MPSVLQVLTKKIIKATMYVNMNVLRKGSGRICSKVFTVVILKSKGLTFYFVLYTLLYY